MLFRIADADQDSAELIIGLRDMVLLPKLGEDGTRHAIQVRSDFFDQVGTQVHHLIDESGERFDAGEAFNGLGAFLRHRVKRAQLGVANAYEQIVRQHKPERRRRVFQLTHVSDGRHAQVKNTVFQRDVARRLDSVQILARGQFKAIRTFDTRPFFVA